MTRNEIAVLADRGEGETVEFKRSTGERRAAAQTLRAMLNQRGGRVLFGVEADGRIVGQDVSDRTLEELAQEFAEIDPPAPPQVERVVLDSG